MSIKDMLCGIDNCICGKGHSCPIDYIEIGDNALKKLPQICMQFKRILLVADQNTYKAAGEDASKLISNRLEEKLILGSECELLIPDEKALDTIRAKVSDKTDLIVGVGSGVINDLCKEVSFEKNLPYYIIATAPSMDGYASVGAALILGGMKVTLNARPPKAIIADADIIRQAPMAGFILYFFWSHFTAGDIIRLKISANKKGITRGNKYLKKIYTPAVIPKMSNNFFREIKVSSFIYILPSMKVS